MRTFPFKLFVDCGAPSLYNRLSKLKKSAVVMGSTFKDRKFDDFSYTETKEYRRYRNAYISFLKTHEKNINCYSNLDVINNAELTKENQEILEHEGLHPIPVFHLGEPYSYLEDYVKKYDYIALGGLIPNRTADLKDPLDNLFKEHLLDDKGFPKVKVHGFACTSPYLIMRYPWRSVDSTTARKLAMYGHIYVPTINDMGVIKTVTISSRPYPTNDKPQGFFNNEDIAQVPKCDQLKVTPKLKERILEYSRHISCDWDTLCSDYMERMLFNHIYFSDLVQMKIPLWPWSFYSGKSKPDAKAQLDLYIAGCFSRKEEDWFWGELCSRTGMEHGLRKRLHSFFYKTQVEHLIDIKRKRI